MSSDYIARPHHMLWPTAFLIGGCLLLDKSIWMGRAIIVVGILLAVWIFIAGLWDAKTRYNASIAAVAHEIKDMDPERYRALGIRIPELHIYASHEGPIEYLEDTEIRMDLARQFLRDSDEYQFAPERLYGEGTRMRRQWQLLKDWLIEQGYLINNSAAGNHTWLWRTGRRSVFMRHYLGEDPLAVADLNQE